MLRRVLFAHVGALHLLVYHLELLLNSKNFSSSFFFRCDSFIWILYFISLLRVLAMKMVILRVLLMRMIVLNVKWRKAIEFTYSIVSIGLFKCFRLLILEVILSMLDIIWCNWVKKLFVMLVYRLIIVPNKTAHWLKLSKSKIFTWKCPFNGRAVHDSINFISIHLIAICRR